MRLASAPDGAQVIKGVAYVLPKGETSRIAVVRFRRISIGLSVRLTSFGLGFDVIRSGALVQVGPAFLWVVRHRFIS